ncbi:MAG: hypothetical protein K2F59_03605 [Eubacteriales bacterium]|nr:hypothetical protein [Eubacteriales bacterium]
MISRLPIKRLQELASGTQLQIDKNSGILFGKRQGYDVCLRVVDNTYKALISFSVSLDDNMPQKEDFDELMQANKSLSSCNVHQYSVSFVLNPGLTRNKSIEAIVTSINNTVQFLESKGYKNCCETCGKKDDISTYIINGTEVASCSDCFKANTGSNLRTEQDSGVKENVLGGIIGALIGSLIGVAAIIIIGQLGYVAYISGIVMAICALKGYEILGKKLGKLGIVISGIIVLLMIYFAWVANLALLVSRESGYSISTSFSLAFSNSTASEFVEGLIYLYVFSIVAFVVIALGKLRSQKNESITHKMES